MAVGPIEVFVMIQSFRHNSTTFVLVLEHLYLMNQIMGVCLVAWEAKVGTSIWWEDSHMGILSPSVFRARETLMGRDGSTITLDIWYPYGLME